MESNQPPLGGPRGESNKPALGGPRGEGIQLGPSGQRIKSLPTSVQVELERYRRTVAMANATPNVPREQRAAHLDGLRLEAKKRLGTIRKAAEDEYNEKLAGFNKTLRPEPTEVNHKLLATMERDRAWRRIKAILDIDPTQKAIEVIKSEARREALAGNVEALNALEEELPAYFRANQMDDVAYTKEATRLVNDARTLTYTPQQTVAAKNRELLEQYWNRSQVAYGHGEHALSLPIDEEYSIPGAKNGEMLPIAGYRPEPTRLPGLEDWS